MAPQAGARHHAAVLPADQRPPLKKGEKGHNNLAAIAKRELGVEVDKTLKAELDGGRRLRPTCDTPWVTCRSPGSVSPDNPQDF